MTEHTFDVAVDGGQLRVGSWGEGPRTLLAAHGITGTHRHFAALAAQLGPQWTLLAPDLRGRGASADLAGDSSIGQHAEDLLAVLDHVGAQTAVVLGHSMGGFAGVVLSAQHPARVEHLVLVDGGIPLDLGPLAALPTEQLLAALIGPALERLRRTFASRSDYYDYWRAHPALTGRWNEHLEAAFGYELIGSEPELRSSVSERAVMQDAESELVRDDVARALDELRTPTTLLRAARGILDQEPPLYPEAALEPWLQKLPTLRAELVPDVNHYTIALTPTGASRLAQTVEAIA